MKLLKILNLMNEGEGMSHLKTETEVEVTQLEITTSGLFAFQNRPVTIYLKESGKRVSTLKKNVNQSAKFHVTPCSTIGDPRSSKRVQRYIATTRTDGLFPVLGTTPTGESEEVEVKLQICRACLAKLNYNNYNSCSAEAQDELANRFNLEELFSQYPITEVISSAIPVEEEVTAPIPPTEAVSPEPMIEPPIVVYPSVTTVESPPPSSPPPAPEPLTTTLPVSSTKRENSTPNTEFTLLTNIYILQALIKRLTNLLF